MDFKELKSKQKMVNRLFFLEVLTFTAAGAIAWNDLFRGTIFFVYAIFLAMFVGKEIGIIEVEKYKNEGGSR